MATNPLARKHHYVSQGYLAAFTATGGKNDLFYVLEVNNGRRFRTSPGNVAVRRDFNRVDVEGHSPDAVENALSGFEGEAIAAIRRVLDGRSLPSEQDWNLIFNFIALLAARNPQMRGKFNRAREHMHRLLAQALVANRETYERHVRLATEAGEELPHAAYEEVKSFIEKGKYDVEFHPQGNLRVEFAAMDTLLPLLGRRFWTVLLVPPDGPEFICSDHPVVLTSKSGSRGPVGFGLRNTEVFFPLGRTAGLYGVFEDPLEPVVNCEAEFIARLNSRVAENAELHVFSALPKFSIWHEGIIREVAHEV